MGIRGRVLIGVVLVSLLVVAPVSGARQVGRLAHGPRVDLRRCPGYLKDDTVFDGQVNDGGEIAVYPWHMTCAQAKALMQANMVLGLSYPVPKSVRWGISFGSGADGGPQTDTAVFRWKQKNWVCYDHMGAWCADPYRPVRVDGHPAWKGPFHAGAVGTYVYSANPAPATVPAPF